MAVKTREEALSDVNKAFGGGETKSTNDTILSALQSKVMGDSGMVSSAQSNIDKSISAAISGIEKGKAATSERLESQFGREIAFTEESLKQERESLRERGSFGQATAALQQLDAKNEKTLRDLDQRKKELILLGESEAANQISQLQIQQLQFKQQAEQQAFANMFNVGQLEIQAKAEDRLDKQFNQTYTLQKKQFEFTQRGKIADIATQYGLDINPGETLESIVTRAKPFASAEQKARLDAITKKVEEDASNIEIEGILRSALQGTGLFESTGAVDIDTAVLMAAGFARDSGFKVTSADMKRFRVDAVRLQQQLEDDKTQIQAEEEGKGFWKSFGSIFGEDKVKEGKDVGERRIKSFDFSVPEGEEDQLTTFFNGLFGPGL